MIKTLHLFIFLFFTLSATAQRVWDGIPEDSTEFTFQISDTTFKKNYIIDTTGAVLWRIGSTSKPFFSGQGTISGAIMTDTAEAYPVGANDYFSITHPYIFMRNPIISFRHKYETRLHKDGGIVEYSLDSGKTWENVKGGCNADSTGGQGILTTDFYEVTDTLYNGEMGFSGSSNGWVYSRLQFFAGWPMRTTKPTKDCIPNSLYLRFRFVSDAEADTLDGWMIDYIKLERDDYGSNVNDITYQKLPVFPNPSYDGIVNFPALRNEEKLSIEVYDATGKRVINSSYRHQLDLDQLKGLYYYRVKSPETVYSGTLLLQ